MKRETLKNKICSLAIILLGLLSTRIDGDCTLFIFTIMLGVPLFLAKKNWIG